jgi:hypothetical protein
MMIGLCSANDQFPSQEFLIVQLRDGAAGFLDRLHLDEGEPFRALVMFVTHYLRVLHLPYSVKELEQVALRRFEGEVTDIEPGCGYFD